MISGGSKAARTDMAGFGWSLWASHQDTDVMRRLNALILQVPYVQTYLNTYSVRSYVSVSR